MYTKKAIPQRTCIKRKQKMTESSELRQILLELELAKESDDALWKELILLVMDDMERLQSEEGKRLKADIMRRLQDDV
ncbi:MAG: hypothetical protein PUG85_06275 [Oscillospiraceae bacterium]|nr:hypothetical protein [Oscillospiraceae bacterium]MDY2510329.1 hypothetical protein [Ruminococcus callidus]